MADAETERQGLSQAEIDAMVASADTGGRNAGPAIGKLIAGIALAWALFQLWFASPLPFMFGIGVFNDTEARSIHLAFAIVLAFLAFPPENTAFQRILGIGVPLVVRLQGTNAEEGREILQPHLNDKLMMEPTMLDAARKAVALAQG